MVVVAAILGGAWGLTVAFMSTAELLCVLQFLQEIIPRDIY